jgi:hypothetical protein
MQTHTEHRFTYLRISLRAILVLVLILPAISPAFSAQAMDTIYICH